jgi:hypothetical protein
VGVEKYKFPSDYATVYVLNVFCGAPSGVSFV